MKSNAPQGYICPICLGVKGEETDKTLLKQSDLIYQDKFVSVFINSFFIKGNEGHTIVVPNKHFENIYDLDKRYGHHIQEISQKMAIIMKLAYKCDGITIRQNNEPASAQHAFHYHMHIIPRYNGDHFEQNAPIKQTTTPQERVIFTDKLKGKI